MRKPPLLLFCLCLVGCAHAKAVLSGSDDFEDYRGVRVSGDRVTRLARADAYLRRHKEGAFRAEVQAVYNEDEETLFSEATQSEAKALDYLTALPSGGRSKAVLSAWLLLHEEDAKRRRDDTLVREARQRSAHASQSARERARVGELVLEGVAAFLQARDWGKPLAELPSGLTDFLQSRAARQTWGGLVPTHEHVVTFDLSEDRDAERREVRVTLSLLFAHGGLSGMSIVGEHLFLSWAEADLHRPLDAASQEHRSLSLEHARERLGGVAESTLPEASCSVRDVLARDTFFLRACGALQLIAQSKSGRDEVSVLVARPR